MNDLVFDFDEVPEAPLPSKRDFIFQLPLFRGIRQLPARQGQSETPARAFLRICHEFSFEAGAVIAEKDELADSLTIVESGRLRALEVTINERNEQVFQPVPSEVFGPGQAFHDIWLFRPATHPHLIQAVRPGRLIRIRSGEFIEFLKSHPGALKAIYPNLSEEARQIVMQSRFQEYMQKPLLERLRQPQLPAGRRRPAAGTAASPREGKQLSASQIRRVRKLDLQPEEYVEFFSRRSVKILAFRTALDLALIALFFIFPIGFLRAWEMGWTVSLTVAGILAAVPLLDMVLYWINWNNCYFVITNRRLVRYELLIFRFQTHVEKIDIDKVQTINVKKDNVINNYLRIGSAEITTAAQSAVLYFDSIDRPERVEEALEKIREVEKALDSGRIRARMREAVDKHYGLGKALSKIQEPAPPAPSKSIVSKIRERFVREEREGSVIYHKHPIALVRPLRWPALAALLLAIGGYVYFNLFDMGDLPGWLLYGLLWALTVGWVWWQIEDWRNDTYQITDRYIYDVDRRPLGFSEDRKVAELSQVQNVRTEQDGLLPIFFNYGNVQVETAGVDSNIVFENVRNPRGVQTEIFARRDRFRRKQEEGQRARQLDQNTTLIEMYEERRARGQIPRYKPLPRTDDDLID